MNKVHRSRKRKSGQMYTEKNDKRYNVLLLYTDKDVIIDTLVRYLLKTTAPLEGRCFWQLVLIYTSKTRRHTIYAVKPVLHDLYTDFIKQADSGLLIEGTSELSVSDKLFVEVLNTKMHSDIIPVLPSRISLHRSTDVCNVTRDYGIKVPKTSRHLSIMYDLLINLVLMRDIPIISLATAVSDYSVSFVSRKLHL